LRHTASFILSCRTEPRSAASRLAPLSFLLCAHSFFQGRRATGIKTALLRIKILFFLKTEPNKDKFYKIYYFNFISQKLSAATQGASNFKIEILYVKLKAYKTPIFRAIQA
jgi:hypothetical protein